MTGISIGFNRTYVLLYHSWWVLGEPDRNLGWQIASPSGSAPSRSAGPYDLWEKIIYCKGVNATL